MIVIAGLFSCLLLIMGLVTRQARLLAPWLLHHGLVTGLCLAAGLYQAVHFAASGDTLLACLSVCPLVTAVFIFFLCVFVFQLYRQLQARPDKSDENIKHVADPDTWTQVTPRVRTEAGYRCVRSVRTLKRRSEMRQRSRSVDHVMDTCLQRTRDRTRSVEDVRLVSRQGDIIPELVRVRSVKEDNFSPINFQPNKSNAFRSEPFLSIPRASLKSVRSASLEKGERASDVDQRKLHVSIIDLNNNVSDQRGSGLSRSNSERMTQNRHPENLHSSHPPQMSRDLTNVISNNLTREQIISLFSAGQEDSEHGPNV